MSEVPEDIKKLVRAVLTSAPNRGVEIDSFCKEFQSFVHQKFMYKKYGYKSIFDALSSLTDVATLQPCTFAQGGYYVKAVIPNNVTLPTFLKKKVSTTMASRKDNYFNDGYPTECDLSNRRKKKELNGASKSVDIYIKNYPNDFTRDDLVKLLEGHNFTNLQQMRGKGRNYALVKLCDVTDPAKVLCELNALKINGKQLKVNLKDAQSKENKMTINFKGPAAFGNRGPPALENRGPPALENRGPPALEDRVPPAVEDRGPPALEDRGPPALEDRGPPALEDRGPPTLEDIGPHALENSEPPVLEDHSPTALENHGLPAIESRGPPALENRGPPALENCGPPALENPGPPFLENRGPPALENGGPDLKISGQPDFENRGSSMSKNRSKHKYENRAPLMPGNREPNALNRKGNQSCNLVFSSQHSKYGDKAFSESANYIASRGPPKSEVGLQQQRAQHENQPPGYLYYNHNSNSKQHTYRGQRTQVLANNTHRQSKNSMHHVHYGEVAPNLSTRDLQSDIYFQHSSDYPNSHQQYQLSQISSHVYAHGSDHDNLACDDDANQNGSCDICIANFPHLTTKSELLDLIAEFNPMKIHIANNQYVRGLSYMDNMTYAYVTCLTPEDAVMCIEVLDGEVMGDNVLYVFFDETE